MSKDSPFAKSSGNTTSMSLVDDHGQTTPESPSTPRIDLKPPDYQSAEADFSILGNVHGTLHLAPSSTEGSIAPLRKTTEQLHVVPAGEAR